MKVLRVRLRNWRGVEDQEVKLAPVGLTIVQGPNETGKSSLVEALDLLFGELDSTTKHHVRAIKPVHRDEGAEVEADVETGTYAFTYTKRFHKRPSTTLSVRAPRPESRTGREAHERADAILKETVDVALWKALRVVQGTSLTQPELKGQLWLSAALDRAASASSSGAAARSGAREEDLFKKVQAERDRWWTAVGGERKDLAEKAEQVVALEAEAQTRREAIAQLDKDVERAATLAGEERRLAGEIAELAKRRDEAETRVRQLGGLRSDVDRTHRLLAESEAAFTRARGDSAARAALVAQAKQSRDDVASAIAARDAEAPGYEQALAAHDTAAKALTDAEEAARGAAAMRDLRAGDLERQRAALDHAQLGERLERIVQAEKDAVAAAAVVATNCCDEEHLAAIRTAHEAVVAAQAKFEAASPAVRVTAVRACSPTIDGVATKLTKGEARDLVVTDALRIELPDLLTIDVRAGGGSAKPKTDLEKRQRELEAACAEAGTADLAAAVSANAALADAQRVLAARDRIVKENLRDLTRARIEDKIATCAARLAQPDVRAAGAPPPPASFDAAQDEELHAREAAAQAATDLEACRARAATARKRYDTLRESMRQHEAKLGVLQKQSADAIRRLDEARAKAADDDLAKTLAATDVAHGEATARAEAADDALAAAEPEVLESIADTLRKKLDRANGDRNKLTEERHTLRGSLNERGEAGLSEKLGDVEARLRTARLDADRARAQALAARTLFEAFDAERRAERSRYVAPFKKEVESLGRIVFGPSLEVEIAENLAIERRTLDGRTLEYDQLSGGAREQLGVIGRLACAQLAAQQGGVPVVLDDAFGFADPDRLERMGALLGRVAATCQVVLLTCDPARARNFPGATVVRLGAAGGMGTVATT